MRWSVGPPQTRSKGTHPRCRGAVGLLMVVMALSRWACGLVSDFRRVDSATVPRIVPGVFRILCILKFVFLLKFKIAGSTKNKITKRESKVE